MDEGPQYRLADFTVDGNSRFPTDDLIAYFRTTEGGLLRSLGIGGGGEQNLDGEVFDAEAFNEAMKQRHGGVPQRGGTCTSR